MDTAQFIFAAPRAVALADALRWPALPDLCFEEKKDGVRALLVNGALQGRARCYRLPGELPPALAGCALDGELVGQTFFAFDVIEADGVDLRQLPLRERKAALLALHPHFPVWLRIIPSARALCAFAATNPLPIAFSSDQTVQPGNNHAGYIPAYNSRSFKQLQGVSPPLL